MRVTAEHKELRLRIHRALCGLHYCYVSVWSFFYCFMFDYCSFLQLGSNTGGEMVETESEMAETAEEGSTADSYFVVGADDDNR